MRAPPAPPGPSHVLFDHFWVETGPAPLPDNKESDGKGSSFVLTPTVTQHLRNLARAVLLRRYPILLQASYYSRCCWGRVALECWQWLARQAYCLVPTTRPVEVL